MTDNTMQAFDRLVGTWKVSGGTTGTITYRWLEGRHFLIQDIEMDSEAGPVKGMEVIGRELPFGAEEGSPAYYRGTFSADGDTLTGAWHYPGGGGYDSESVRIR